MIGLLGGFVRRIVSIQRFDDEPHHKFPLADLLASAFLFRCQIVLDPLIQFLGDLECLTKTPAYSAAKAAISNFTEWMAVHFSKVGIRVNAIAPGYFSTAQNKTLLWNPDGTPTARTGKILAATPMGRFGEPEELNGAVLFLLNNEAAGFITGVVLPIDGGVNAYSGV